MAAVQSLDLSDLRKGICSGPVVVCGERGSGRSTLVGALGPSRMVQCVEILKPQSGTVVSLLAGRRILDPRMEDVEGILASGLVAIEDVQWADDASSALLRSGPPTRALVVTICSDDDPNGEVLAAFLNAGFKVYELSPLGVDAVAGRTSLDRVTAAQVAADCGGNQGLLAWFVRRGYDNLKAVISSTLDACSPSAHRALADRYLDTTTRLDALGSDCVIKQQVLLRSAVAGRVALDRCDEHFEVTPSFDAEILAQLGEAFLSLAEGRSEATHSIRGSLLNRAAFERPTACGDLVRRAISILDRQTDATVAPFPTDVPHERAISDTIGALLRADSVLVAADRGKEQAQIDGQSCASALAMAILQWARAEADLAAGRPAQSHRRATTIAEDSSLPSWLRSLSLVTVAWSCIDRGTTFHDAPRRGRGTSAAGIEAAAVTEMEALRALVDGDLREASSRFTHAAGLWATCHVRGQLRCGCAAEESTRRDGGIDDSLVALRAVEELAERSSSRPLLAKIRASQRACGVRRSTARTSTAAGLTRMEERVLELMGRGLTNRQIALEVDVSITTVDTHVEHVLMKLGAGNRIQAVAIAAERDVARWQR